MISSLFPPLARMIRRARAIVSRPVKLIDQQLWDQATSRYGFVQRLSSEENRRLRLIASDFLARKTITGAAGQEIDDLIRTQIAAQACILVLELGVNNFDGWTEIVVYPGHFTPEREFTDAAGVVHTTRSQLAGEAWLHGPVVLSYDDVARTGDPVHGVDGYNVVIHEFAHVLDMGDGEPDGIPPLPSAAAREAWIAVLDPAFEQFCAKVDAGRDTLLDPYGATSVDEFFAVASETFFVSPKQLRAEHPDLYGLLARYFQQDPAAFTGR